jgi:hypothetical protein
MLDIRDLSYLGNPKRLSLNDLNCINIISMIYIYIGCIYNFSSKHMMFRESAIRTVGQMDLKNIVILLHSQKIRHTQDSFLVTIH